jgi:AGZA family xanthine/uracil permease-like MFS transporter
MESKQGTPYRWARLGDINAFFGLMLDNVVNLVILAGILIFVFGFPEDLVYKKMFPGTALGVMFGDLVYTWLAFRLAKKTGRDDVTAMPLGLDAPSNIGMAFAVLGPAFIAAKNAGLDPEAAGIQAWKVGMATMVLIGVFKLIMSFFGGAIQRAIPQAGLLGTLGGIGIALLGCLQLGELFVEPVVGMVALGLLVYGLIAQIRLPFGFPNVFASVLVGTVAYYALGAAGLTHHPISYPTLSFPMGFPTPTLGFLDGLGLAFTVYLPVAIPFAVLTVIGGINVTESARIAGDDYDTREVLLTEAFATLIAGVCGGVSQSTPYIGQPAYKAMGGRAAYTLATGLFVGLGGIFGYIPFMAKLLPTPALTPILLFVAVDIVEQSFHAVPRRHAAAVTFAMFPNLSQFVRIILDMATGGVALKAALAPEEVATALNMPGSFVEKFGVFVMLAHGFILTGMLWGAAIAFLIDRRVYASAVTLLVCAGLTLFGVMHSVQPDGGAYLPWNVPSHAHYQWAAGYAAFAVMIVALAQTRAFRDSPPRVEHA